MVTLPPRKGAQQSASLFGRCLLWLNGWVVQRMHVWNVLHAARWNTGRRKSPSAHHCTTSSGCYVFANKACIDNRKKILLSSNMSSHMSSQYGELRPTKGWDALACLGHTAPVQISTGFASGVVTTPTSLNGGQPNCTMLGRLLRWHRPAIDLGLYTFFGALAPAP